MANEQQDITPELEGVLDALRSAHGVEAEGREPIQPRVLLVGDDFPHTLARHLLERLEQEGLSDRVVIVGPGSTLPKQDLGIEHVIQAIQDRDAVNLSLTLPNEPAWLTEQHNRKPTPRKR